MRFGLEIITTEFREYELYELEENPVNIVCVLGMWCRDTAEVALCRLRIISSY